MSARVFPTLLTDVRSKIEMDSSTNRIAVFGATAFGLSAAKSAAICRAKNICEMLDGKLKVISASLISEIAITGKAMNFPE